VDKVTSFTATTARVGTMDIPIGRNFKNEALKILNKNNVLL
jgi:hypothetical protein